MPGEKQKKWPPAVFLMGPTASGKTQLAVELVKHLPLEIISVDSALVYKGMDIGTAKPDAATLKQAPHRLINIRDPSEPYSAALFREDALREMADITSRHKIPLLVGGTMLYFKTLLDGLAELPATDPDVRAEVEAEAAQIGWPMMHARLAAVDPVTAAQLHPNHSQRIGRALEVYKMAGETFSSLRAKQDNKALPYRILQIAIAPHDREVLHRRIQSRFHQMMAAGFLTEAQNLYERGDLHPELPSMRAVGYRQAWTYFEQSKLSQSDDSLSGNLNREQMVERAIIATRQLAKRQLTWLRGWPNLQWIYFDSANNLEKVVAEVQHHIEIFTL